MPDESLSPSQRKIDVRIERSLATLLDMLDEMTDSPHTRELRAKVRSYERVVRGWSAAPPSGAQRAATLELVSELQSKVADARRPGGATPSRR
jgi:hypothetical protein